MAQAALGKELDTRKLPRYRCDLGCILLKRSLLTGRLVDWLDPWRIVELEQAVLNAQVRPTAKTAALTRFTMARPCLPAQLFKTKVHATVLCKI